MTEIKTQQKLATFHHVSRKGVEWLLNLMNDDGSIGPVEERIFYYRVPWALALMGEVGAANRLLDWIRRHMFSPEGAFAGVSPQRGFESCYGSYPLACLIAGASFLNRFDIVYPGIRHLLTWRNPESGGFYNCQKGAVADREEELCPTCQAGMTLLVSGQLQAALDVGEWTKRLWELQPNVERELYVVRHSSQGLVTDFPEDQAASYVTKKDDPWQHHFNSGIAAAFLSQLYMATGDGDWLDLARKFQGFSMTTDPCQFKSAQICKSGWGSGLLYVVTREPSYRDWTGKLGDWFTEHQHQDGHWENTKFWTPNPTLADNIEITAEFVIHVANIVSYLSVA